MGQTTSKQRNKDTKKVIGAIQFISQEEYDKMGFYKTIEHYPVLVYSETDWESTLFWKETEYTEKAQYQVVYEYMIDKKYTIEEAQEAFPELFL